MEPVTWVVLSTFVSACLTKVGEKFSEKVVETAFESRKELAEKFAGLFKSEINQLGLSDPAKSEEIIKQLDAKPEIIERAAAKLQSDLNSFKELMAILRETAQNAATVNNFANQINNDKSVNVVGDNTSVTF